MIGAYCASLLAALIGAGAWVAARRFVDAMQRRLEEQEAFEAFTRNLDEWTLFARKLAESFGLLAEAFRAIGMAVAKFGGEL